MSKWVEVKKMPKPKPKAKKIESKKMPKPKQKEEQKKEEEEQPTNVYLTDSCMDRKDDTDKSSSSVTRYGIRD